MEIKLNEYAPIIDSICIDSVDQDQVYEIKFQGKPPNIKPLTNSIKEKNIEKTNIEENFLFNEKKEQASVAIP